MSHVPSAKPRVASFGNTTLQSVGSNLENGINLTGINRDKLGKSTGEVEFTEFERSLKDYSLMMLGHPVVRVELTEPQIRVCIDEAITMMNYHAPLWTKQYATFEASAGTNLYEIPPFILDNLEYVVYKKTLLSVQSQAGTLEFDFFIKYFQDNFLFQNFGVADFYLLQQNLEMTRKVLGQEGTFNVVDGKYLLLSPAPSITPDVVILEYRTINTATVHPAYRNWMQRYTLACVKGILGQIRGKYKSLPSPAGGAQLNGDELMQQSQQEKTALMEELVGSVEEPPVFTTF